MRVLIVDPDPTYCAEIASHLQSLQFHVTCENSVASGLDSFKTQQPSLVLFDPQQPGCDDKTILGWLRQVDSSVPIVIASALNDPEAAARCLLAGADDYIRKPFDMREFEARIKAVLRRSERPAHEVIIVGQLQINDRLKQVTVGGVEIGLSPKEYQLLQLCAQDPGRVFSHEEIIDCLWPQRSANTGPNDIKQYVHLLRTKLGKCPSGRQLIENVKGFGYRLAVPAEESGTPSAVSA